MKYIFQILKHHIERAPEWMQDDLMCILYGFAFICRVALVTVSVVTIALLCKFVPLIGLPLVVVFICWLIGKVFDVL